MGSDVTNLDENVQSKGSTSQGVIDRSQPQAIQSLQILFNDIILYIQMNW